MRTPYLTDVAMQMHQVVREAQAAQSPTVPVPVARFLRDAGWQILNVSVAGRFEATTLFAPRIIAVNTQPSPFAQHFALAHEWIHVQYHAHHMPSSTLAGPYADYLAHPYHDEFEVEANAGAAELLLPYAWFMDTAATLLRRPLRSATDLDAFLASDAARRWAGQAQVTRTVLRYHLVECGWLLPAPIGDIGDIGESAHAVSS